MSGSIPIGPVPPLVSRTQVPLQAPASRPATPAGGAAAFPSLLAGSPAPAGAAAAPGGVDPAGRVRMAGLAPTASRLPVAPGPQAAGRILATADLSMAAWAAPVSGPAVPGAAASFAQVAAVRPAAHPGLAAASRLLPPHL